MYAVIIGLALGTHSLFAVTVTWDGSAGTGAWATGANWDSGSRPANGDDLIFDANAANSQFTLTLAAVAGTLNPSFRSHVGFHRLARHVVPRTTPRTPDLDNRVVLKQPVGIRLKSRRQHLQHPLLIAARSATAGSDAPSDWYLRLHAEF